MAIDWTKPLETDHDEPRPVTVKYIRDEREYVGIEYGGELFTCDKLGQSVEDMDRNPLTVLIRNVQPRPREWWISFADNRGPLVHFCPVSATVPGVEIVHVREVME